MAWWNCLFERNVPAPLRAVPATRRQKNYAAATGYAYEYFYEGLRDEQGCRRHYFTVSGDRKNWFPLVISVEDRAVEAWQVSHRRKLADSERYAIAKMALFEAFDTRPGPSGTAAPLHVGGGRVEALLGRLGLD